MTPQPSALSGIIANGCANGSIDIAKLSIHTPLTPSGVAARRAKNPPLSGGIAAATSSDMFKGKVGLRRFHSLGGEI